MNKRLNIWYVSCMQIADNSKLLNFKFSDLSRIVIIILAILVSLVVIIILVSIVAITILAILVSIVLILKMAQYPSYSISKHFHPLNFARPQVFANHRHHQLPFHNHPHHQSALAFCTINA